MFSSSFTYTSSLPLDTDTTREDALPIYHDFGTVIHLNPNCIGFKRLSAPPLNDDAVELNIPVKYDVEDSIPFIPRYLWKGGVHYTATVTLVEDGCDILVEAPLGFHSMNKWRLIRASDADSEEQVPNKVEGEATTNVAQDRWAIQISSENHAPAPFASFISVFIKGSHAEQQKAFRATLEARRSDAAADSHAG